MDDGPTTDSDRHWRAAVWALRLGYLALVVAFTGLVLELSGSTPWVLAAGAVLWLVAAAVTLTEALVSRHGRPEPRQGWWSMRLALIHDSVHARPGVGRR